MNPMHWTYTASEQESAPQHIHMWELEDEDPLLRKYRCMECGQSCIVDARGNIVR